MPLVSILRAHYHRGLCRVSQKRSASGGRVYVEVTSDQVHPLLLPKSIAFKRQQIIINAPVPVLVTETNLIT